MCDDLMPPHTLCSRPRGQATVQAGDTQPLSRAAESSSGASAQSQPSSAEAQAAASPARAPAASRVAATGLGPGMPARLSLEWMSVFPPLRTVPQDETPEAVEEAALFGLTATELRIRRSTAMVAEAVNCHNRHSHTCAQGGRKATDAECRMGIPCPYVTLLRLHEYDLERGTINLARGSNRMVPYCPALMRAWVRAFESSSSSPDAAARSRFCDIESLCHSMP